MKMKKERLKLREMKNLSISLLVLAILLLVTVSYIHPKFQGFAVQDNVFNLEVEIPSVYGTVEQGSEIHFTTKIFNLAGENRMDVSLRYDILDGDANIIVSKTETMAIETQASFVGSLKIPEDAAEGSYDIDVTLLVNGVEEAKSRGSFKVMKQEDTVMYYTYIVIASVVCLLLVVYLVSRSKVILEHIRMKSKIHRMVRKRLGN